MVDHHRRRLDLVGREHPARVAHTVGLDHAQVLLLAGRHRGRARGEGLDPARCRAGRKASRKRHGHWIAGSSAVLRSNPNAMLKHSTPCPDAPFTRLSRAAVTTALSPCALTFTRQ